MVKIKCIVKSMLLQTIYKTEDMPVSPLLAKYLTRVDSWAWADILEGRVVDGLGEERVTAQISEFLNIPTRNRTYVIL